MGFITINEMVVRVVPKRLAHSRVFSSCSLLSCYSFLEGSELFGLLCSSSEAVGLKSESLRVSQRWVGRQSAQHSPHL